MKNTKESPLWTSLSDDFRCVAHKYKDGHIDYRFVWMWFQEQSLKYDLTEKKKKNWLQRLIGL